MKAGEKLSLQQIQAFLTGSEEIHFEAKGQADLRLELARDPGCAVIRRSGTMR